MQPDAFALHMGASGTVQCWGFLPNGRLPCGWTGRREPLSPTDRP